ncbi:MAG TPA: carboxypeptidase-like regulatory domain-containing protein [Pyrinomonadaceae bacterium]|nr:carboxypeptidase-like regulatory domain-containing protein [Pyrinomonadaceae bacterium]
MNPLASAETDAALSIFGVVMDPNGAVVPNVKLVLRDATKKIELTTFTDSDGKYSFPRTAGGVYDLITAGTAGFIDLHVENISIRPDYKTELNIVLNVDVETTVLIGVVAGPEGSIDMSPEIKTTITREMLDRIPGRRLPF